MIKNLSIFIISLALLSSCQNNTKQNTSEAENTPTKTPLTEEQQILTKEVTYSANGVEMKGYLAYDNLNKEKKPGVLVIHEWWGHNEHARDRAEKLAEMGYVALAIDMYGDGKQANHPEDASKFSSMVMKNIDEAKARFDAAYNLLQGFEKTQKDQIAAIGFCFGGSVAMTMANMGADLEGVVAFHSGLGLPIMPEKGKLKTPMLIMNGADDPFITEEQVNNFKAAMDVTQVDYQYITYDNTVHAFTNKGADSLGKKFNIPLAYNEEADKKSWKEMRLFFDKIFSS